MKRMFVGLILLFCLQKAGAAGFEAELTVTDGATMQIAKSDADRGALRPRRASVTSTTTNLFTIRWKITRRSTEPVKDTLVHFYAVRLDRQGQMPPALDPERVIIEGALTMDFSAKDTASGTQNFRVDAPGVYLIRVDAGSDPEKPGIEDLAEIELVAN